MSNRNNQNSCKSKSVLRRICPILTSARVSPKSFGERHCSFIVRIEEPRGAYNFVELRFIYPTVSAFSMNLALHNELQDWSSGYDYEIYNHITGEVYKLFVPMQVPLTARRVKSEVNGKEIEDHMKRFEFLFVTK